MADLSSLLNPAPSSDPTLQEADAIEKSSVNGKTRPANLPHVKTASLNEQQPSIKSPLDTLADAATSSAPLLSPTNPIYFMNIGAYAPSNIQSSSRSTSSRITPPLPSHAPGLTSPTFSPGLQQYHHPTGNELRARRASEAAEHLSDSLPPLRQSISDQRFPEIVQPIEPPLQDDPPTPILPGITAAANLDHPSTLYGIGEMPMPSQFREASPQPFVAAQTSNLPTTQSEQVEVKTETTDIVPNLTSPPPLPAYLPEPSAATRPESEPSVVPMTDTTAQSSPAATPANDSSQGAMLKPPPATGRKRPAPKKGTATAVKPAAKKRKVETAESIEKSSPARGTPTSSRASKTPAPRNRRRDSATPQRSSSVVNNDEDEDEDGVFCICRGPDNHTWMIACDGPCEDWFHGKCINMTEKEGELIEKYYCPNCFEAGKGETLWKRMCRLEDCRKPARVNGTKKSKYCSDAHGCEFMKREAFRKEEDAKKTKGASSDTTSTIVTKGRKTNNSFVDTALVNDVDMQTQAPESDPQPGAEEHNDVNGEESQSRLRGGILQSSELKALVSDVQSLSEFRKLGKGPLRQPNNAESNDVHMEDAPSSNSSEIPFNPAESDLLQILTSKKDGLRARKRMLDDRDILLILVRERAKTVLDELRTKDKTIKDICGFDCRLAWVDEEFEIWRNSPEGANALKERKLGAPTVLDIPKELAPHLHDAQKLVNGDQQQRMNRDEASSSSAPVNSEQQPETDEIGKGVCQKKRCERHRQWYKIQQQDIAFAKDEVRQEMRKLDEEEKGVRDRAKIRWLEAKD
ncbi:MAG: hypothetical protein Q9213_001937 [Squamulea squamosa]